MAAIAREKTSEMWRLGVEKCLYVFGRRAGSCPHSRSVRNREVSARRESTVCVREIQASLLKKMLKVRYCLNCLTRDVR